MGQQHLGKSDLAVELAKQINGEIISADSMQIYKEMNIGTAKIKEDEMQGIKHYMLDFVSPNERYSVSDYKKQAEETIEDILSRGKNPIIVGGTGLYIESLIYGIEFHDEEFDEEYRKSLRDIAKEQGLDVLYERALEIDRKAAEKISPNDEKRIIRILEIYNKTGETKTKLDEQSRTNDIKYDYKFFAINLSREKLYDRINSRVDKMLEEGLISEVKRILEKHKEFPTAMQGIGYKEVVKYINEECTYDEMVEEIKKGTRHYAKRQITWFKKYKDIIWLDGEEDLNKNVEIIRQNIKQ